MHHSLAALSRGDVLACGGSLFIVHQVGGAGTTLVRVRAPTLPRHRADLIPQHWCDVDGSGLPLQDVVIRCVPFAKPDAFGFAKLGKVRDALMRRIDSATAREIAARRFEETPRMRSMLTVLNVVGSRGRQVGRQNAT